MLLPYFLGIADDILQFSRCDGQLQLVLAEGKKDGGGLLQIFKVIRRDTVVFILGKAKEKDGAALRTPGGISSFLAGHRGT